LQIVVDGSVNKGYYPYINNANGDFKMTINDLVLAQNDMGINEWLAFIVEKNLQQHEHLILECANHHNKITVNHNATFLKSIS
jgi:hypothetical protein